MHRKVLLHNAPATNRLGKSLIKTSTRGKDETLDFVPSVVHKLHTIGCARTTESDACGRHIRP